MEGCTTDLEDKLRLSKVLLNKDQCSRSRRRVEKKKKSRSNLHKRHRKKRKAFRSNGRTGRA